MRIRKLLAVLLALGYLADVHCRIVCAGLTTEPQAPAAQEKSCHAPAGEAQKPESKPCCMTDGNAEAVLPAPAPAVAPAAAPDMPRIAPPTVALAAAFQALRSQRNQGRLVPATPYPRPPRAPAPPAVL